MRQGLAQQSGAKTGREVAKIQVRVRAECVANFRVGGESSLDTDSDNAADGVDTDAGDVGVQLKREES
eukprot:5406894-Pleurochrysis_carterae.AAC.1